MEFKGVKIDFMGLAQVLMAGAAVLTAWRGMHKASKKKEQENAGNDRKSP